VQLTPSQKAELGDQLPAALRFGICAFEIDGDAENRSEDFHFLAVSLPLGTKLQNSMQPNLGSKNRFSVP
jgi:hypothetical protein